MKIKNLVLVICAIFLTSFSACSTEEGIPFNELSVDESVSPIRYSLSGSFYSGRVFEYTEGTETLVLDFNVLEGFLQGDYKEFYSDGSPKRTAFFEAGVLNGLEKKYHENGQLKESVNYVNGNFNGKRMVYWTNGILKEQNSFQNGILGGENLFYYSDGKLRKSLKFNATGKREGQWEDFHPNGQLKQRLEYKDGVLISSSDIFDYKGQIVSKR